ncbi:hypothetical protein HAX54_017275, partial [Datura stramonium]|nr:hypothetical protein [Datura stramonium]
WIRLRPKWKKPGDEPYTKPVKLRYQKAIGSPGATQNQKVLKGEWCLCLTYETQ